MPMTKENFAQRLETLLKGFVMVSITSVTSKEIGFGHPCANLINDVCRCGVAKLAKELMAKSSSGEYRLNGAGFKMYYRWQNEQYFYIRIGGDQIRDYPNTGPALQALIDKMRLESPE